MRRMVMLAATAAVVGIAMAFTWLYCTTAEQMSGRVATWIDYTVVASVLTLLGLAFVAPLYDMTEVRK